MVIGGSRTVTLLLLHQCLRPVGLGDKPLQACAAVGTDCITADEVLSCFVLSKDWNYQFSPPHPLVALAISFSPTGTCATIGTKSDAGKVSALFFWLWKHDGRLVLACGAGKNIYPYRCILQSNRKRGCRSYHRRDKFRHLSTCRHIAGQYLYLFFCSRISHLNPVYPSRQ